MNTYLAPRKLSQRILDCRWILRFGILAALMICGINAAAAPQVSLIRTPHEGIQPQGAVDSQGTLHLIYFKGKPAAGDIFYVNLPAGGEGFSEPTQVNSQPGSAIAVGTIRGAQLAIGKGNRVHVAWNGTSAATSKGPKGQVPMLYTRLNDAGSAFEPERNVIREAYGLDGGGAVAADQKGNVYVAWHGNPAANGEANRKVYFVHSTDEGATFDKERPAFTQPTGACGCCGMKAAVDAKGTVYMLYRSAKQNVNRDMYLLVSKNQGKSFDGIQLDKWQIANCPMSSESFTATANGVLGAWDTDGQVYFTSVDGKTLKPGKPIAPPGGAKGRKHPSVAVNAKGETLLVWTEGTGWERGGTLAWQMFDKAGKPTPEKGRAEGVPVWGLPTASARPDGCFLVIY